MMAAEVTTSVEFAFPAVADTVTYAATPISDVASSAEATTIPAVASSSQVTAGQSQAK
jgi:hypothetical protein